MINYFINHFRAFRLSLSQLSIQPITTFITFAVIGIALALPMGFFVLLKNVQTVTTGLHETEQISLYLKKNVSPLQSNKILNKLKNDKEIASTKFISAKDGLAQLQQQYDFGNVLSELNNNPLPAVIVVQPVKSIKTQAQVKSLLKRLKKISYISSAQLDFSWLNRLNAIISLGKNIVYALMFIFAIGVLLIIGNTIGLITQKYSDKIFVLQLLGATNSFIRRPFLYSGMIYGLLGGIFAWFLINLTLWWLHNSIDHLTSLYGSQFKLQLLSSKLTLVLMLGGAILGYAGSWLAVNRHVKSHFFSKKP